MKKFAFFAIFSSLLLLVAACNKDEKSADSNTDKVSVYTTVYPLTYFTERIGGDYVDVKSIYPPGANEHHFEPTQKDLLSLADSDLFFFIGLNLEPFVPNAEKSLAKENVEFINISKNVPENLLHKSTHDHESEEDHDHEGEVAEENHDHESEAHEDEHDHDAEATEEVHNHEGEDEHNHGDIDPHIWLSPAIAKNMAETIKNSLTEQYPEQKDLFNENYEKLVAELDDLNKDIEDMANSANNKTFFVSHEAFGYMTEDYGLEQVGIAGLNSQDEPSQKELTQLVDLAKELNIKTIFFEQNVSSNVASVIQKEIGAESKTLHNLSVLTNDDMKNQEDYFTLMEKNIESLKEALK